MRTKILSYEATLAGMDVEHTFLRRSECEIRKCSSGSEILEVISDFMPELVVVEEIMPGTGGVEVARSILSNPMLPGTRVLLVYEDEKSVAESGLEENERLVCGYRPLDNILLLKKLSKLMNVPARIHVRAKVVFEVKGRTAENQLFYGRMLDVSTGGFLFQLDRPLKLGDVLYCFFSLSRNEQLIFASARIVRFGGAPQASQYVYGVEFVNLRADDRRRIAEFIFRHSHPEADRPRADALSGYNVTFL